MDAIAGAINELTHTWVPTLCLVAKMYASFKQLTQIKLWKSHVLSFPVFALTEL
jgi:hypothetical protein